MPDSKPEFRKRRQGKPPPTLDIVQKWFQAVITHPDGVEKGLDSPEARKLIPLDRGRLEQVVSRSNTLTAQERLSIYGNAYYARLVECLGECFPVFREAVGKEVFNGFAFEYLQHYPSRSYTLNRLDEHFARFFEETRPDRGEDGGRPSEVNWPDFLVDLATLEWTIGQVFDGPGMERSRTLTADDLQAVEARDFARAKLTPVVCLRLLTFRYPVNAYYTASRRAHQDERLPIPEPAAEFVAITRHDYVVRRYSLPPPQHALLKALQAGDTVGEAIASASQMIQLDDEQLAGEIRSWFHFWTAEQFFQCVVA